MLDSPLSVRLPVQTRKRIKALADREHRSISRQVVHLLELALIEQEQTPTTTQSQHSESGDSGELESPDAPEVDGASGH